MTTKKKLSGQKKRTGRKLFDGKDEKDVIRKLEEVWALGGTDAEAAFYANISKASLSEYLSKHPVISERKEELKNKPILLSRQTIIRSIATDFHAAKWYLQSKLPEEFVKDPALILNNNITLKGLLDDIDGSTSGIGTKSASK